MSARLTLALLAAGALAACDPAGPATVGLTPFGQPAAEPGDGTTEPGAPLDAMRPDASPLAVEQPPAADAEAVPAATPPAAEETPADLAAAATAVVADTPDPGPQPVTDTTALNAYARAATHGVGTTVYLRDFASPERAARACARYASADQAQSAFLEGGGPGQDPRGLDPDGDGYACGWDPVAFRSGSGG